MDLKSSPPPSKRKCPGPLDYDSTDTSDTGTPSLHYEEQTFSTANDELVWLRSEYRRIRGMLQTLVALSRTWRY